MGDTITKEARTKQVKIWKKESGIALDFLTGLYDSISRFEGQHSMVLPYLSIAKNEISKEIQNQQRLCIDSSQELNESLEKEVEINLKQFIENAKFPDLLND